MQTLKPTNTGFSQPCHVTITDVILIRFWWRSWVSEIRRGWPSMTTVCSEKSCYGQHKVDKDCLEVKGQKLQWGSNVYFGQYSNLRARIWSNNIRNYNDWMNPYISRFSILLLLLWGIFITTPPLRHRQSENMARLPVTKTPGTAIYSPESSNMTSRPSCDSLNWIEDGESSGA